MYIIFPWMLSATGKREDSLREQLTPTVFIGVGVFGGGLPPLEPHHVMPETARLKVKADL